MSSSYIFLVTFLAQNTAAGPRLPSRRCRLQSKLRLSLVVGVLACLPVHISGREAVLRTGDEHSEIANAFVVRSLQVLFDVALVRTGVHVSVGLYAVRDRERERQTTQTQNGLFVMLSYT